MSTTPRPKPLFLDLGGITSVEDLKQRLPNLFENTDYMLQIIFEDMRGLADDIATVSTSSSSSSTTTNGLTTAQALTRVFLGT
jgi:hypothetical protein